MKFIIQSIVEKDEDTNEPLYWNNKDGWVDINAATEFSEIESLYFHLPENARWMNCLDIGASENF